MNLKIGEEKQLKRERFKSTQREQNRSFVVSVEIGGECVPPIKRVDSLAVSVLIEPEGRERCVSDVLHDIEWANTAYRFGHCISNARSEEMINVSVSVRRVSVAESNRESE